MAATAKPDDVGIENDAETTTLEAETVTDVLITEGQTTITERVETSTDALSQEATTSKGVIEDPESTDEESE